jgi:hypothetical protein
MPATDGKILLTANAQTCAISLPSFGYRTTIALPFDIQELDNGAIAIYDHGATATPNTKYDVRTCECDFLLSATEMALFTTWYKAAASGRGVDATLEMTTNSGFHPFGPDKGDAGPFTVAIEMDQHASVGEAPWLHFPLTLRMTNTGSWPAYKAPDEVPEGGLTIGTVTANRFPPGWYKVDGRYGAFVALTQSAVSYYMDKGTGADWFRTKAGMVSNESKAARVIAYLTGTSRATALALVCGANSYPFGVDKEDDGTYSVRMIQDTIEITHKRYNEFEYDLTLEYISGPT